MTFEYECNNCHKELELELPLAMRDQARCPTCHFTLVRRVPARGIKLLVPQNFHTTMDDVLGPTKEARERTMRIGTPHPDRNQSL